MIWAAVLVGRPSAATCSSSPACPCRARVLERPVVERIADLLPVALLAALVGVQVFGDRPDGSSHRRPRWPASASAFVALLLRAPFIVVVLLAALSAALVRLL